jgi:hypothetical protein
MADEGIEPSFQHVPAEAIPALEVGGRGCACWSAARRWAAGRYPAVPGETESIPLPQRRPAA